jgi:hypothetical protein
LFAVVFTYDVVNQQIVLINPETSSLTAIIGKIKISLSDSYKNVLEKNIKVVIECFKGFKEEAKVKSTPFTFQLQKDPPKPFI